MPILTIGTQSFNYPDPGDEAGWGEDATGWATAVTLTLSALLAPGDILPTTLPVVNNVTTFTDITGLVFSRNVARAANVYYQVSRYSDSQEEIVESGTLLLTAELETAPVGAPPTVSPFWTMIQTKDNDAGIIFSVSDSGQISYKSTDIGLNQFGTICFTAKTLPVV